jgi:hypothetical protein
MQTAERGLGSDGAMSYCLHPILLDRVNEHET